VSLPVILRPDAQADIQSARATLDHAQVGLGDRFVAKLREVFKRIEDMPELYGFVYQDVRAARVRKFRYVAFYIAFADRAEVLAVLHGSQDASTWQLRV